MSKDLEQLRLNMITSLMDLDHNALLKIKEFMLSQENIGWEDHINDENVDFVDFSEISEIAKKSKKAKNPKIQPDKPSIIFL